MDNSVFYFIVGLLSGMIIMFVILYACFYGRVFIYEYCATTQPLCYTDDYINNPSDAIQDGFNVNSILFLENNNLYYRRPQKTQCTPIQSTIQIQNPQYCEFYQSTGSEGIIGKALQFNSTSYELSNGDILKNVSNCKPSETYDNGVPLLMWN